MLFVLLALWMIASVLLLSDIRRGTTRWLSAVAFCGGMGALAALIGDQFTPYIVERYEYPALEQALYYLKVTASLTSYYGLPYTFLMFAIHYNRTVVKAEWKRYLSWILLLPIAISILFTPAYTEVYPISFRVVVLWAVPYVLLGAYLILIRKEFNRFMRRTHLFTSLAVIPAVLFATTMNYILPSMGMLGMWRYNTWVIVFGSAVFLYSIFKYGFLGIQFLVERRRLDYTLRAITSGTAILNHSIKNDVGKMKLFTDKIRRYAEDTNQAELQEDIKVVMAASAHIQEMVNRVQGQTQDLALKLEECKPAELIDQVLQSLGPMMESIKLQRSYSNTALSIQCDQTQVMEVLNNIIVNAIEAMPGGGELKVKLAESKKYVMIEVKDSGVGIAKENLRKVLEPFYTTKTDSKLNFGLGLAYCYNVLAKHNGSLDIFSEPNVGTTVTLNFPKKS
jgi:signal transduction histidine kinase